MSEQPPKYICEFCGGAHLATEHTVPTKSVMFVEERTGKQEVFLRALNDQMNEITGDLEAQGWKKTAEYVGHDEQYDAFSGQSIEVIRSYSVIHYRKEGWEIEKTHYDPERGHFIFDIRYHPTEEESRRKWYPKWLARIEIQRTNEKENTSIYLRESPTQALGLHFSDKNFDRLSRYYDPSSSSHAGQLTERSKNYRSFNWDRGLIERNLPPVNIRAE